MKLAAVVLAAVVACSSGCAAQSGSPKVTPPPGGVVVRFGSHAVSAELAVTEPERERGLMFRRHVTSGAGMLFLMARSDRTGFWMKNTLVPLSIAYMRREAPGRFRVVALLDMQPCRADPCTIYWPGSAYDAALEVSLGWLLRHGVGKGDIAVVDAALPSPSA